MSESPDIVYGRLLEAAHISGYGFERMCREVGWLLDDDRWKHVGPGYEDINAFVATIDLSAFNMEHKKPLAKKLAALRAKQETTAKALGVNQSTVSRWSSPPDMQAHKPASTSAPAPPAEQDASRDPELPDMQAHKPALERSADEVAKLADKAARKDKAAAETKARREASRNAEPVPDGLDLRIGDARKVLADVASDSVSLVLTDPPYGDEAEPLYRWLAEWSARVLVPGGSLICYTGQSRLDRDIRIFAKHLRYWWQLVMLHHQSQRLPGKFVTAEFKPVLWFVKDHRRGRTLVNDVLRSPKREKDDHDWAQGEGGVPLLLEQLTDPGELIADPFAGTGRWGEIATGMGRRWIGADVQPRGDAVVVA